MKTREIYGIFQKAPRGQTRPEQNNENIINIINPIQVGSAIRLRDPEYLRLEDVEGNAPRTLASPELAAPPRSVATAAAKTASGEPVKSAHGAIGREAPPSPRMANPRVTTGWRADSPGAGAPLQKIPRCGMA